jgi:hypothetical protein
MDLVYTATSSRVFYGLGNNRYVPRPLRAHGTSPLVGPRRWWDLAMVVIFSLGIYVHALRLRLPDELTQRYVQESFEGTGPGDIVN